MRFEFKASTSQASLYGDGHIGYGRFQLPPDDSLIRAITVHPEGFADASPQQLVGQTAWALQQWGRIEGKWVSGNKPAINRHVLLDTLEGHSGSLQFDFVTFAAESDENGRFHFDHVPPGKRKLTRLQGYEQGNGHRSWQSGRSTEVDVPAGEVTSMTFGASGHQVTAKLVLPAGQTSYPRWQVYGVVQTPAPGMPPGMKGNPEAMRQWWQTPEHRQLAKAMKLFLMDAQPDGTISTEEVEPGNYAFYGGAVITDSAGKPTARAIATPIMITIPAEPAMGVIDLGVITLQPDTAPR